MRRSIGCRAEVLVARVHIERIFDVGLPSGIVMKFCLDADAPPVFLGENIYFVWCTAAVQCNSRLRFPTMRTQDFCEKLFKRKSGWAEREDRSFDGIARRDRSRFFFL